MDNTISKAVAKFTPEYIPSIQGLLDRAEDDWGVPDLNRKNLIKYGIPELDLALWGIDTTNGELNLILGPEKQRKTTFAINILCNTMEPTNRPRTVVDTLESGMHPVRYRDAIISVMATRLLLQQGHKYKEYCPICRDTVCRQIGLSPEFLRFANRTEEQQAAIKGAMALMYEWPLYIYGAPTTQGNTRNLMLAKNRWNALADDFGMQVLYVDHVQQYSIGTINATDYEKQIQAIAVLGEFIAQHKVAGFVLSQVSLTSQREAREGSGKLTSSGGTKSHQEANTVFSTSYKSGSGRMKISIVDSRKTSQFALYQPLEDESGAFYGTATRTSRLAPDEYYSDTQ